MGKRRKLTRLRYEKNKAQKTSVTGVIGMGHCVGVTHFSILLANFLTGVRRKKTSVLEWNKSGCFERMRKVCNFRQRDGHFSVLDADYFPEAGENQLLSCMEGGYHEVIIDFGDNYQQARTEFLRCDHKFVIVSMSEWQIGAFLECVRALKGREKKELEYFVSFGSDEARREAEQALHIKLRRIPVSADAFTVTKEVLVFFETIL